jgi:ATP-dependent exoDNAse (exonuclease V) beta subunit
LLESLDGTPELARATMSAEAEDLRLLYVTLTRARDYLVLCLNRRGNPWLEMSLDKAKLSLPLPEADGEVQLNWSCEGTPLDLHVFYPGESMVLSSERQVVNWVAERSGVKEFPPARLSPSKMEMAKGIQVLAAEPQIIGERIDINGKPAMDQLGTALHGFIAADRGGIRSPEERLSMLHGILERHGMSGTVDAKAVIRNADAFYRCMKEKFHQFKIMTEWPVYMLVGNQRMVGNVDMILDTPQGWVVIDHKSFPGGAEEWKSAAISYDAQVKAYVDVLEKASGKKIAACFVHFLIGGGIVQINFENRS